MYITTKIRERIPEQMTFDQLFERMLSTDWTNYRESGKSPGNRRVYTRTWHCEVLPERIAAGISVSELTGILRRFNSVYADLHKDNIADHYTTFYIPKKTGGLREINQPDDYLSNALRELKRIFEEHFFASHHSAAFAYVKGRSTKDAVRVHQRNESWWFLKTDLSGFFPSTSLDFVMRMLGQIYPFALVVADPDGKAELKRALSLCFLKGGLPMGTPISPMLTNLIMIPFDYELSKYLRSLYKPENNSDRRGRRFVYTRYADDMHISCRIDFDWKAVQREIHRIFKRFGAPYVMKAEKTHYGSRSGQNWMLGIMLNKDNKMTIGHKKKRQFEAMLHNYLKDRAEGRSWENGALFYMQGVISYYRMVNEAETNDVLRAYGERHNLDIEKCVKDDLAAG